MLLWGTGALLVPTLPGLPSTPWPTLVAVPLLSYARDISVAILLGALLATLLTSDPRPRRWALGWGGVALGLITLGLAAIRSDIAAVGIADGGAVPLGTVIGESLVGKAAVAQAACVALALVLSLMGRATALRWAALGGALLGAGAPGFAGHAGLAGEHAAAALAIVLHVAAACLWVGGLAVVVTLVLLDARFAPSLLPRFSVAALVCVLVAGEAGLLSASLAVDSSLDLLGTSYGSLVLVKALVFAGLAWLGWLQRRRALDLLPDRSVTTTVARYAGIELVAMGVAVAAAVVMARIGPSPVPGAGFAPLSLVVLGVGLPLLVVLIRPNGWRRTDSLPEVAAVVLLLVIVEIGGVGFLRGVLGPLGLLVEVGVLSGAGWLAVSAARHGWGGVIVLAVGLPVALVAASVLAHRPGSDRMTVVAILAAEALVVGAVWLRRARSAAPLAAEVAQ